MNLKRTGSGVLPEVLSEFLAHLRCTVDSVPPSTQPTQLEGKINEYNFTKFKDSFVSGLEMAQQLRTLTVLPEDPGSISNTQMAAYSCL